MSFLNKKRYFIASYVGNCNGLNSSVARAIGNSNFICENSSYLNKIKAINMIIDDNEDISLKDVVITNIIEISKEDYENWSK